MFKATNLFRNVFRLSELKINNNIINTPINNCVLFYNKINFYCTQIDGFPKDIDVNELTNGDPVLEKKLKILLLEVDVLRQEGSSVPDISFLKLQHWKELLEKPSKSSRKKYLSFLFKLEKKKENRQIKKEKARIELENRPEYVGDGHIRYGLNHNTFLIRIYDSTINKLWQSKLINAMRFGQKLIVDCGYDHQMMKRECTNTAKQIMLMFSENRINYDPFDLHLCNAKKEAPTMSHLNNLIATIYEPDFPLNIHEKSYLELFPKEKLVYLTPHCREELKEYDHDAIYIIGGIVDKMNQEPLSLAKAKKEGLKMCKLPLDHYLQWGGGSGKSLTLNCMINILLDIKNTGDWAHALRHVPRRKLVNEEMNEANFGGERFSMSYDKNEMFRRKENTKNVRRVRNKDFVKNLLSNR